MNGLETTTRGDVAILQSQSITAILDVIHGPNYRGWKLEDVFYQSCAGGWWGRTYTFFAKLRKQTVPVGILLYVPGGKIMIQITDAQKVNLKVPGYVDLKGNPTTAPGVVPRWTTDKPTVLTLTPAADGLSCFASAVGPEETATVTVTADLSPLGGPAAASQSTQINVVGSAPAGIAPITNDPPVSQ